MIKIGFLVSYDYEYLKVSIPLVYPYADTISLAIDINRKTWTGDSYNIPNEFFDWLKTFDTDNKISILQDDFYIPSNSAPENDTRQRNMLAEFMGKGGWHIQLDSDEYFYNFPEFLSLLRKNDHYLKDPKKTPITFGAYLITLFKKVDGGYLYINSYESFRFATNYPKYFLARNTGQKTIFTKFCLFHHSWARGYENVAKKIKSWGHTNDFVTDNFLSFWDNLDKNNYPEARDFCPVESVKTMWKRLYFGSGNTEIEFMENYVKEHSLYVPAHILAKKKITSRIYFWLNKNKSLDKLSKIKRL